MTQAQSGKVIGVTQAAIISEIERGKNETSILNFFCLADVFGVDPRWLALDGPAPIL